MHTAHFSSHLYHAGVCLWEGSVCFWVRGGGSECLWIWRGCLPLGGGCLSLDLEGCLPLGLGGLPHPLSPHPLSSHTRPLRLVDRQTPVKILPCPKLRLPAVKILQMPVPVRDGDALFVGQRDLGDALGFLLELDALELAPVLQAVLGEPPGVVLHSAHHHPVIRRQADTQDRAVLRVDRLRHCNQQPLSDSIHTKRNGSESKKSKKKQKRFLKTTTNIKENVRFHFRIRSVWMGLKGPFTLRECNHEFFSLIFATAQCEQQTGFLIDPSLWFIYTKRKRMRKFLFSFDLCRSLMWTLDWIFYDPIWKRCHFRFRFHFDINEHLTFQQELPPTWKLTIQDGK